MVRTPGFDKNGMKKGAWSPEEDNKLRAYIQRYGHWNWRELPKFAGLSRCGKSCRLRWMNYLRPSVKRGNYTKEEEDVIIKLHEGLGNRWSAIAAKLPGRTDNEIKNHWHTHLKKRLKQQKQATEIPTDTSVRSGRYNRKREVSPKHVASDPPQPILESSDVRSLEPSSSEISSLSSDYAPALSAGNWVAEETISSSESLAEHIENFWTEPFLADTSFDQNVFSPSILEAEGFLSPYGLYYDDGMDSLYQLLQGFSQF